MIALNLTIWRKWFNLIRIGIKREEYRTCDNRQVVHLAKEAARHGLPNNAVAVYRNGYNMGSAALAVQIAGLALRSGDEAEHPEWGEPTGNGLHFVISLGRVLYVAPYYDVRKVFMGGAAE